MSFRTDDGEDAVRFLERISTEMLPTEGDMLYALGQQKARILKRTASGVDFEGRAFEPYSDRGPYYYYPGRDAKHRSAARSRFLKSIGATPETFSRLGIVRRTSVGVRYESYAAFKRSLGRSHVDLTGPRAPHMLQAMVVKTGSGRTIGVANLDLRGDMRICKQGIIGIYGEEAERAEGHQEGAERLPKRRFLDASGRDIELIKNDIMDRIIRRLNRE